MEIEKTTVEGIQYSLPYGFRQMPLWTEKDGRLYMNHRQHFVTLDVSREWAGNIHEGTWHDGTVKGRVERSSEHGRMCTKVWLKLDVSHGLFYRVHVSVPLHPGATNNDVLTYLQQYAPAMKRLIDGVGVTRIGSTSLSKEPVLTPDAESIIKDLEASFETFPWGSGEEEGTDSMGRRCIY